MKFKIGDRIRGISDDYCYTDKNMYLGEVTDASKDSIIIKILKHKESNRDKIAHLKREIMSLKEENKQILDNAEKRYLENVIRPFKDRVISVIKENDFGEDYIKIDLNNGDTASLPNFVKGSMYKGMRSEKKYTLKELGLFEEDK